MDQTRDLNRNMTTGVKWAGLGQGLGFIIQFVVWAILARLLPPSSFGALSAAMVFSNLATVFNELGMSSAIVQRKELNSRHTVTAFWLCVLMGFFFILAAVFCSTFLAKFFKNDTIKTLVIIFALKYFVDSFGIVQEALLRRALAFSKIALADVWFNFTYSAVALFLAYNNFGIMSVGWGYLAASLVRVSVLWKYGSFRPYFGFGRDSFRELFSYGKNILGFKVLNYFTGNMDVVLIGKFMGTTALGYYSLASALANFPRQKLSLIISNVAFPAFSRIQDDYNYVRQGYLKIIRYSAAINFPLLAGLMLLAPQFVSLVYSAKWEPMVMPLRILCFYGICFSLTTFVGVVYESTGHPDYSWKFCIMNLIGTGTAILLGFKHGLTGIAVALSIYAAIINILGHLLVKRIIKMRMSDYLRSMVPALVASIIMAMGIGLLLWAQVKWLKLDGLGITLAGILSGITIYSLSLFMFSRQTFAEIMDIGRALLKGSE